MHTFIHLHCYTLVWITFVSPKWPKSPILDPSASSLPPYGLHLVQDPPAPIPLVEAKGQTLRSSSLMVLAHPLPPTIFQPQRRPLFPRARWVFSEHGSYCPSPTYSTPLLQIVTCPFSSPASSLCSDFIPQQCLTVLCVFLRLPPIATLLFHFFPHGTFTSNMIDKYTVLLFIVPLPLPECKPHECRDLGFTQ